MFLRCLTPCLRRCRQVDILSGRGILWLTRSHCTLASVARAEGLRTVTVGTGKGYKCARAVNAIRWLVIITTQMFKRYDSHPRQAGKPMVSDVTVVCACDESYVGASARETGAAAELAVAQNAR